MSDQPPSQGTTTTPDAVNSFLDLVVILTDDKKRAALERHLTSQVVDQPRATAQQVGAAVLGVAQSTPFFGKALSKQLQDIALALATPVEHAKAIQNAPVEGVSADTGADPVELATGQLVYSHTDLSLDGAGIRFDFVRTYRSHARYPNGPLGAAWDHNHNLWLREVDGKTIVVGSGQLREDRYRWVSPGSSPGYFAADAGIDSVVIKNAKTQKFELRVPGGLTHQFVALGTSGSDGSLHRLERSFDRFQVRDPLSGEPKRPGNYLLFGYDDSTQLLRTIEVNHPTRLITLDYDDLGRIVTLKDYTGRQVTYTYDDYDDLAAATLPATQDRRYGRTTFYRYSSDTGPVFHLLTSVRDADGRNYLDVEYGLEDGFTDFQRVVRQRDDEGEWLLQYANLDVTRDPNAAADPDVATRYTCVDHPNGHEVEYWFNELGNILFKADNYLDGQRVRQRALWRYQYNPDGKLIASLSPEGAFVQHCYFRDEYALSRGFAVADPLQSLPPPTLAERQSFGRLIATIRRSQAPLALATWPDPAIANGVRNASASDIVQRFEAEPDTQLPLRVSDPRETSDLFAVPGRWLKEYQYSADDHKVPVSITHPATHLPDGTAVPATQELFVCDQSGRVIDHVDPEGHTTHHVYFQDADIAGAADPSFGVTKIHQPDPLSLSGFCKSATVGWHEPNAASRQFVVNRRGLPTATTEPNGTVTVQAYDASDLPVQITRTLEPGVDYATRYRYTGQAKVFRTESPILDDVGAPVLVDGKPLGTAVHQYRYTDTERVRRESIGGLDALTFLTTRHAYECSGRPARHYSPGESVTALQYDSRGLLTRSERGHGTVGAIGLETFYGRDGRATATRDGRGCVVRFEFDSFGRKAREIQVVDLPVGALDKRPFSQRLGHTRVLTYDKLDNIVLERFFQWIPGDTYELLSRIRFVFDERGRKIKEIRDVFPAPIAAGAAGVDAFVNSPPGAQQVESWLFLDGNDRTVERREGVITAGPDASPGSCTKATFDYAGRRTVSSAVLLDRSNAEVSRTESTYDVSGNLLRTDQFDAEYENAGLRVGTEVISHAFKYDALNRRVATIDGLGNRTTYRYDSRNLALESTDPLGRKIRYDYDVYGRRQRVTQYPSALQETLTSFECDGDGQIVGVVRGNETNANLSTVRYVYNAAHCKTAMLLAPGTASERITLWGYDGAGNVVGQRRPSGLQMATTYDHANRVVRVEIDSSEVQAPNPPIAGALVETFARDGLGRIIGAETDAGATSVSCEYDSLGRVLVETQSMRGGLDLRIARAYNALGQRIGLIYPSTHQLQFEGDLTSRLVKVTDSARGVPNVGLPVAGSHPLLGVAHVGRRVRSETHASGVQTVRAYDGAGRLIAIDHRSAGAASMLDLTTLYDSVDNVRADWQEGSAALTPAVAYLYDGLNRLNSLGVVAAAAPDVIPFAPPAAPVDPTTGQAAIDAVLPGPGALAQSFQYDAGSNRIAETVSGSFTPVDALDRRVGLAYDDNGNPLTRGIARLTFDGRDRLVRWDDGIEALDIQYDALGRRVSIVDATTGSRRFAYDGVSDIAEYRDGVLFSESLVTAPPDGRSILFCGGDQFVLHGDRVRSIRLVSNSSGAVVGRYDFDPYGQAQAGGVELPLLVHRFMGREWDAPLALYHFRARHYDPRTGAFLQRDPVDEAAGASSYRAFASNPLIFVDPMGTTAHGHMGQFDSWASTLPGFTAGHLRSPFRPTFNVDADAWRSDGLNSFLDGPDMRETRHWAESAMRPGQSTLGTVGSLINAGISLTVDLAAFGVKESLRPIAWGINKIDPDQSIGMTLAMFPAWGRGLGMSWQYMRTALGVRAAATAAEAAPAIDYITEKSLADGAKRIATNGASWERVSLSESIDRHLGSNFTTRVTETGKVYMESSNTGRTLIVDPAGYLRIAQPKVLGGSITPSTILNSSGFTPDIFVTSKGGAAWRSVDLLNVDKALWQEATHFLWDLSGLP